MSWSDGYHVEAEYTSGYYKELSPTMQRFSALLNGYDLPPVGPNDAHMELGFGQGVSINIHAAAQPGFFIGNDFNPTHAAHAQQLALASGAHTQFSDESFAQLDARSDLPMCSSISFHGIWSWINDENRQHMLNLIQRCLKPGGVVYNSYNILAGHAAFIPWRNMMVNHFNHQSGNALQRIEATIIYVAQIFEKNPHLLEQNPSLKNSWNRVVNANRNYLLHEYFNANWDCFTLHQVADLMSEVKCQFIGSINNNQYMNHIHLNPSSLEQVSSQPNILEAESWRDVLVNNTFRRDLYVKGGRRLSQREIVDRLKNYRFVMTVNVDKFGSKLYSENDGREFSQDLFDPIRDVLAKQDYRPKSFQELLDVTDLDKYNWSNILQIVLFKIENSQLHVCASHEVSNELITQSRNLNTALLKELDYNIANVYLACPTTGSGLVLDFAYAWTLRVWLEDINANDQVVFQHIWQCLQANNRLLMDKNGNQLSGEQATYEFLKDTIQEAHKLLPIWKQLGVI